VPATLNDRRGVRSRRESGRRRRYPRIRLGADCFYQSPQRCLVAADLEVNLRGAFVPTAAPDAAGTRAVLRVGLPGSPGLLKLSGQVVWSNQHRGRGPLGMGIRFDSLEDWQIKRIAAALIRTAGFQTLGRQLAGA
jgi:Tfp pilus assembly protein PilZ